MRSGRRELMRWTAVALLVGLLLSTGCAHEESLVSETDGGGATKPVAVGAQPAPTETPGQDASGMEEAESGASESGAAASKPAESGTSASEAAESEASASEAAGPEGAESRVSEGEPSGSEAGQHEAPGTAGLETSEAEEESEGAATPEIPVGQQIPEERKDQVVREFLATRWDRFTPTDEDEVREIVGEVSSGSVSALMDPLRIRLLINYLNGVTVGGYEDAKSANINFELVLFYVGGYDAIQNYVKTNTPGKYGGAPLLHEMLANKKAYYYVEKYFEAKQPIYDAYEAGDMGRLLREMAQFTDAYYEIVLGTRKLFDEIAFEELPLEAKFVILRDQTYLINTLATAYQRGLSTTYNVQQRYDLEAKRTVKNLGQDAAEQMMQRATQGIVYYELGIRVAEESDRQPVQVSLEDVYAFLAERWDRFTPDDSEEYEPIVQKVSDQMAYAGLDPGRTSAMVHLLNGVMIDPMYENIIVQAVQDVDTVILYTAGHKSLGTLIATGIPENWPIVPVVEEMLADKEAYYYVRKYFEAKQPICDAYDARDMGRLVKEIAQFTDAYHEVILGQQKLFGEISFEELPLEVRHIILRDQGFLLLELAGAEQRGLLTKYGVEQHYSAQAKASIAELMKTVEQEMVERTKRGIVPYEMGVEWSEVSRP